MRVSSHARVEAYQRLACRVMPFAAIVAILLIGFALRLDRLEASQYLPLDPDAVDYMQNARSLHEPYETAMREPAFIWLVKGAIWTWGDNPLSIRRVSVAASLLSVGLTFLLGSRILGPSAGAIAAGLVAINTTLISESVRGLREEVFGALLLALVVLLLVGRPAMWRWVASGLVAALLSLVRMTGLVVVGVLFIDAFVLTILRDRLRWRYVIHAASSILILLALVSPYLVYSARAYKDPFISVNAHASFWRNMEFGGRPGFPSRQAIALNGYTGPPVTTAQYVFGLHSVGEIVRRYGDGAAWLIGWWSEIFGPALVLFGVVGVVATATTQLHFLSLALVFTALPFLFVLPVGPDVGRFLVPTAPLFALCIASALMWSAHRVTRTVQGRISLPVPAWYRSSWLVAMIAIAPVSAMLFHYAYRQFYPQAYYYREDFNDGGNRASHEAKNFQGWSFSNNGLVLGPGQSGEVLYRFKTHAFRHADLEVWFYHYPEIDTWLEISFDGRSFTALGHDTHYVGDTLDLSRLLAGHNRFFLRFRANYAASLGPAHLILDAFALRLHD